MKEKVYLTHRNVQTLINKLDRVKGGDVSACTLLKQDNLHAKYPQTMRICAVTAMEFIPEGTKLFANHIYLTRQNLNDLLNTKESIQLCLAPPGEDTLVVNFVEDEDYYGPDRPPGFSHDAPK